MKVINLYGGPGIGKSTTASGLFYEMKKMQLNVELVTEYAKDVYWEKRSDLFDDQIYMFAKQHRRIKRLNGHGIDWVITDSPFPLGLIYLKDDVHYAQQLQELIKEVYTQFTNYNFLLQRNYGYNPVGRNQKDEGEAILFDQKVTNLLCDWEMPFYKVTAGESAVDWIMREYVRPLTTNAA